MKKLELDFAKFILYMLHLVDVTKLFFTGYYDYERNKVILSFSKVAK